MSTYLKDSVWVVYLRNHFGISKPTFAQMHEWDNWEEQTRAAHPVGWFLTETVPEWFGDAWDFITSPYYDTRYYIRNRFYRKTHVLRTDCPLGKYWDTDERILSGLANAVIDYVEVELAFKSKWCNTDESKTAKWRNGRCPELGLAHLAWEMTLDDPTLEVHERCDSQASSAREIRVIYDWAKTRDARPDPHDASGWSEYCNKYPRNWRTEEHTDEQRAESDAAHAKLREIEQQYDQEDEDMLIRIIKIRRSLWS